MKYYQFSFFYYFLLTSNGFKLFDNLDTENEYWKKRNEFGKSSNVDRLVRQRIFLSNENSYF